MRQLKKTAAYFLLAPFLFIAVITPAKAILPALIPGLAWAVEALIGDAAMAVAIDYSAAAIGTAIYAIDFHDKTNAAIKLNVRLSPKAALPVPTGWTAPATSGNQPTAPSTTPYRTGEEACKYAWDNDSTWSSYKPAWQYDKWLSTVTGSYNCQMQLASNTSTKQTFTAQRSTYQCPAGYSIGATNCTLSNSSQVIKPEANKDELMRSGNTFVRDPQQNPADSTSGNPNITQPTTGQIVAKNPTGGQTTTVTINQADGTSTIQIDDPQTNGTTKRTTINVSAPDASTGATTVTGTNVQTFQGTGSSINTSTTVNPPVDVSNLATHADVGAVGTKIDTTNIKLDTLHTDLTADGTTAAASKASGQSEVQTKNDALVSSIQAVDSEQQESLFDEVGNLIKPFLPSGVACTPWTGSVIGKSFSFDWCPYIDKLTSTIGWLMALFSMFSIFQIATRVD